jgi:hypothetical protein
VQENEERWRELCERAAKEMDPVRLQELIQEINRLLELRRQSERDLRPASLPPRFDAILSMLGSCFMGNLLPR